MNETNVPMTETMSDLERKRYGELAARVTLVAFGEKEFVSVREPAAPPLPPAPASARAELHRDATEVNPEDLFNG